MFYIVCIHNEKSTIVEASLTQSLQLKGHPLVHPCQIKEPQPHHNNAQHFLFCFSQGLCNLTLINLHDNKNQKG